MPYWHDLHSASSLPPRRHELSTEAGLLIDWTILCKWMLRRRTFLDLSKVFHTRRAHLGKIRGGKGRCGP